MTRRDRDLWVYGRHAVETLLDQDPAGIVELWVSASSRGGFVQDAVSSAQRHGIAVHTVPRKTLDRKLEGARHQGVAARCARRRANARVDLESVLARLRDDDVLLVLDEVQDPHNLGSCLRTADGAGAVAVVVPRRRASGLTPAARKVASGAAESATK